SLANPRGGVAHGWEQVSETIERAAASRRDGETVGFEIMAKYVTPELACVVQVERLKARFDGGEDITQYALRVTMIFRPENGVWKVVHRHADSLTTVQPAASYEVG
ncbi:MAG TPA: nuclear transport factor 2 family protein, partial [Rubrobacter sp.]|nr:nuclear transport factor 2 family protein [Rubrobacter sp.]